MRVYWNEYNGRKTEIGMVRRQKLVDRYQKLVDRYPFVGARRKVICIGRSNLLYSFEQAC